MMKCEIGLYTEGLLKDGSANPDDWTDQGIVETLYGPSIDDLIKQIKQKYNASFINSLEYVEGIDADDAGFLEAVTKEYNYQEKYKYLATWHFYFSNVKTDSVDPKEALNSLIASQ
jgi:hypothetical protein